MRKRFSIAGFLELSEKEEWSLAPKGKYFFIRNASTIIAFTVGSQFLPESGFTLLGAHTDSPCLKIQPVSCSVKSGVLVLNSFPYGGGLWHTWFDRDLGISGRIHYKDNENNSIKTKLVFIDRPVARIPNLAIHLTSGSERESFSPNVHEHCKALFTIPTPQNTQNTQSQNLVRMNQYLADLIGSTLSIDSSSILNMELQLTDLQPPSLFGLNNEFLCSGRLDNLCSAYQSMKALIDCSSDEILQNQSNIRMIAAFDHEEVGSSSSHGAGSNLFMETIHRIMYHVADATPSTISRTLRNSLIISIDMAHALHPNYPHKHDANMAPVLNGGVVLKHNANLRYATNGTSAMLLRELAAIADVKVQEFSVRADSGCGRFGCLQCQL